LKGAAKKPRANLGRLATEKTNPASADLDLKPSLQVARIINSEDAKVAAAVKRVLPQIAQAIDIIASALQRGGRLIYVGTGTSGRIAALDAAECPPTFDTHRQTVQFIIAGGVRALSAAVEADEDSPKLGEREIAKRKPGRTDVVVGIAASGRTPFTVAAIAYARRHGAQTIAVTCNRNSPLEKAADLAIVTEVGPEVISGSTRMKAGTAQKMVLNMLTTGTMILLGKTYGNLMVDLKATNNKLKDRSERIVVEVCGVTREEARKLLQAADKSVKTAIVMQKLGVSREEAEAALARAGGVIRRAIPDAPPPVIE